MPDWFHTLTFTSDVLELGLPTAGHLAATILSVARNLSKVNVVLVGLPNSGARVTPGQHFQRNPRIWISCRESRRSQSFSSSLEAYRHGTSRLELLSNSHYGSLVMN